MKEKLTVPIENMKLVVLVNDWHDGLPKEICIYLESEAGEMWQDICLVREHYSYNAKTCDFEVNSQFVDCKVWSDSDHEDYTHEFVIGIHEEE